MKRIVATIATLVLTAAPAFAADLFRQEFKAKNDGDSTARIVETFKLAIAAKKPNPVQAAVKQLKADLEDTGQLHSVTETNMFQIYQGKGSASAHGQRYIVGVPVTMDGTGMIETYGLMYVAYYAIDMATGKESVTIEKQLEIDPQE